MSNELTKIENIYCKKCDFYKPLSDFHRDSSTTRGRAYYCKSCATGKSRAWHRDNKDCPEYKKAKRDSYFKFKYNLSPEDRIALLNSQNNCCAICKTLLQEEGQLTHIDHCHTTGNVRGALCTNCNRGLGSFKDNTLFLQEAINYLERNRWKKDF